VTRKTWLITDSFSKVFKIILHERLQQHININNNLVKQQFGIRPGTSTDKASYRLINEILNAMEHRYQKVTLDNNLLNSNADWGEGIVSCRDQYLVYCSSYLINQK
jgi:hypothetical protein